jgi:hypothetical protein
MPLNQPWIRIATDNQGLITRIKDGLAARTRFAGAGLSPEYDVVNEIIAITQRLPFPLKWEHVKGHQDDKKQWYELTWMETLNVRADLHATSGLDIASTIDEQQAKKINLIPSSKVALRIYDTDITSHHASHLRKAATRPAIVQRTHKHHGWTPIQFEMIDWKAHQDAMQKLRFAEQKFIKKFTHQSLPMGDVYHKIDPSQSTTCWSCKVQTESDTHLYRCPARRDEMEDFLRTTLGTFLQDNHSTCPKLANTLIDGLYCNLHDARYPAFKIRHGSNEPEYRKLHQLQACVGWTQLFQGRLVKDWAQLQDAFLEANKEELQIDRRYNTGDIWARKIVSLLWKIMRTQWDNRNRDLHGDTREASYAIRRARLLTQIQAQYQELPAMLADDRDLLAEPIAQKAKQSPSSLELWLTRTRPIVKLSKQDLITTIKRTHHRITNFFRRPRNQTNEPNATA